MWHLTTSISVTTIHKLHCCSPLVRLMSYRHNTPSSHHVSSQVVTGQHVYKVIKDQKRNHRQKWKLIFGRNENETAIPFSAENENETIPILSKTRENNLLLLSQNAHHITSYQDCIHYTSRLSMYNTVRQWITVAEQSNVIRHEQEFFGVFAQ